jgi:uncharacterized OsmC-like protein
MSSIPKQSDKLVNGLNTETLGTLAGALQQNAGSGRVRFHSDTVWTGAAQTTTLLKGFTVDGQTLHNERRRFELKCDEPVELGSHDSQAAPAEQLLHAVASCIAATTNAYAALSGVKLTKLDVMLECDIDLHGIFGIDENVRPGMQIINADIHVAGDADADTLKAIVEKGVRYSPMRDTVQNGVTVSSSIHV